MATVSIAMFSICNCCRELIVRGCLQFLILFALAVVLPAGSADAQDRVALKSGESADLGTVYWVAQCRSIMLGLPTVEILEGPPEVSLSIKEGMVLPRRQNCAQPVSGGTLVVSAKAIREPMQTKLTYRLKYKTKDGERVRGGIYNLSLYP
jgi:hypothetical protein